MKETCDLTNDKNLIHYLDIDILQQLKTIIMLAEKYINEEVKKIEVVLEYLKKENYSMEGESHIELANSLLLDKKEYRYYRTLIRMALYVVILCRLDVLFSTI